MIKIIAFSGSLRKNSFNTQALYAAEKLLPANVEMQIFELEGIPLFNSDDLEKNIPYSVSKLQENITAAQGVMIASPEYNFSVTGVLKNTLDWISKTKPQPLKGKPVAILSATTGPLGGARSQYDLRKILGSMEAMVMQKPEIFIGNSATRFKDGLIVDEITTKLIEEYLTSFKNWIQLHLP